jgi:hypothetical protein
VKPALIFLCVLYGAHALAQAPDSRFSAGGYYRIMARPDFQGGNGRLGHWNLYGRLMNEGPYAALEMKLDLLQAPPGTTEIWASLHARVEGGSVTAADSGNGNLINFRVSQLYARAGNIIAPNIVWQLGTQQYFFGDLGLYDLRFAQLFEDTIGLSAQFESKLLDVRLTVGDSGFANRGVQYVPLLTAGGAMRLKLGGYVELAGGGQVAVEPFISGNRNSSYATPGVTYEDFARREVLRRFLETNPPGGIDQFPVPVASKKSSTSYRAIGALGFGKLGPLRWDNLFVRFERKHPNNFYADSWEGRQVNVYIADLTRDRYSLQVGNEAQFHLLPRFDVVWAVLYGSDRDYANKIVASEANRTYMSSVLRGQVYLSKVVHLLVEGSIAEEKSLNGNLYRSNFDSIFQNTEGVSDTRGLEFGDAKSRSTYQLKAGIVLNPTGLGIYARPSIRLLYGFQYSTQHAAFGNGFVERLEQFDAFRPTGTISWHHLISLESEGWF